MAFVQFLPSFQSLYLDSGHVPYDTSIHWHSYMLYHILVLDIGKVDERHPLCIETISGGV